MNKNKKSQQFQIVIIFRDADMKGCGTKYNKSTRIRSVSVMRAVVQGLYDNYTFQEILFDSSLLIHDSKTLQLPL